jgi:hypothetical protein
LPFAALISATISASRASIELIDMGKRYHDQKRSGEGELVYSYYCAAVEFPYTNGRTQ